ncbi:autotransporter domain-containing protein [Pectobacterium punjabense]|uniref:autotransporter domain-containing protein n=1 Tax=Pectobacterium punjabense TaxID=2108399 RepID=UPI00240753D2|nr:autotransporter domain-containing protein [Pectobacterium punjabense]MDG0795484.1 autotransporter domain-containing protein [Pectobacterium punjabense]
MLKQVAVAVGMACLCVPAWAYDYGDYARETVDTLINDYPGRYRDTANFAGAADWMTQRMAPGYSTVRQDFSWTAGGATRSSQNVLASNVGLSSEYIITGAHFDTFFGRPTLQGLDDNASGAAILTEVARNFSGIQTEKTLVFAAFGAEEEGLRGSRAMVNDLMAQGTAGDLKAMINMDSMITGDKLYAHAGDNSVANPALASLREQTLRIANELGIDLFTNPGLNASYPAGTGCCSDGDSFNAAFDIPVLYMEATNWDIGDRDGYEQTTNPAVPGGATWHDPTVDNEAFLTSVLGQERIDQRLRDVSRVVTRLLLEISNTDLLHSAYSAAAMQQAMEESLKRQRQSLSDLHNQRWLLLQNTTRRAGTLDTAIGIEGDVIPSKGFDRAPQQRSRQAMAYALMDYQLSDGVTIGGSLSLLRSKGKLERNGHLESDTWQAGVYGLLNHGGPAWLGSEVTAGRAAIESRRSVHLQSAGGPVLLNNTLDGNTEAQFIGARVTGGYDFPLGGLRTGPIAGLDYARYRINAFDDKGNLRTGVRYEKQDVDSLEASVGWRVRGNVEFSNTMSLQPYATVAWVRELADGLDSSFTIKDHVDGANRRIAVREQDKNFGKATVGLQWLAAENLNLYSEIGSRFGHRDGDQTRYSVGVQWQF